MDKIAPAFIKAKMAFGPVLKGKTNPAFKSKYANLEACLDAVDDACLSNGIALYQETVFLHESGQALRCGKLHVPASKQDPQGYGSALTYARRYSLLAAAGIAAEDDDGNAASRKPQQTGMASQIVADWITYIKEGVTGEDVKHRLAEATEAAKEVSDEMAYKAFRAAAIEHGKKVEAKA
jgi:hypothetical protein